MAKIGELVHIDCHQLSKGITIADSGKTYYLLGLIDDYSRQKGFDGNVCSLKDI